MSRKAFFINFHDTSAAFWIPKVKDKVQYLLSTFLNYVLTFGIMHLETATINWTPCSHISRSRQSIPKKDSQEFFCTTFFWPNSWGNPYFSPHFSPFHPLTLWGHSFLAHNSLLLQKWNTPWQKILRHFSWSKKNEQ